MPYPIDTAFAQRLRSLSPAARADAVRRLKAVEWALEQERSWVFRQTGALLAVALGVLTIVGALAA